MKPGSRAEKRGRDSSVPIGGSPRFSPLSSRHRSSSPSAACRRGAIRHGPLNPEPDDALVPLRAGGGIRLARVRLARVLAACAARRSRRWNCRASARGGGVALVELDPHWSRAPGQPGRRAGAGRRRPGGGPRWWALRSAEPGKATWRCAKEDEPRQVPVAVGPVRYAEQRLKVAPGRSTCRPPTSPATKARAPALGRDRRHLEHARSRQPAHAAAAGSAPSGRAGCSTTSRASRMVAWTSPRPRAPWWWPPRRAKIDTGDYLQRQHGGSTMAAAAEAKRR